MKKICLISIIAAVVTLIWYIMLLSQMSGKIGACVCPEITPDTYQGPNWPSLLPEGGCGDCGLPEPPSQFFQQLFLILLPAIIIFILYGAYEGIKKLLAR